MESEPEVTTMGERGQVVIPKSLRDHLGIPPHAKFIVFGQGDYIILKRLELPDVRAEWERIFDLADRQAPRMTEEEVAAEVEAARRERKRRKTEWTGDEARRGRHQRLGQRHPAPRFA